MPRNTALTEAHEWVSIPDPDEDRTWMFDVTFLLSNWTCIFGRGCQGVLTAPAPEMVQGCCSYGAHFVDDADAARVEKAAAKLTPDQWQFMGRAKGKSALRTNKAGIQVTRLVDGACIFLNRPGFPGGPGCALHRRALETGERPMDLKPEVCWQLPLRREDLECDGGHVVSTVGQWDRRHWGRGGADFAWWCTDTPDAFVGSMPVYQEMAAELEGVVGRKAYRLIASYLDQRRAVALPHPVTRKNGQLAPSR
jgi:hypothetical protein